MQMIKLTAYFSLLFLLSSCCKPGADENETVSESVISQEATSGNVISGEHHQITLSSIEEEGSTHLVVVLNAINDFHVNVDFPLTLTFPEGSAIEGGPIFRSADATISETEARFSIATTATDEISAEFRFGVCDEEACETPTETLQWTLTQE